MKQSILTLILSFFLFIPASALAGPKLDFWGDGYSDPMFFSTKSGGESSIFNYFKYYQSWYYTTFGSNLSGDMNVPADYSGNGETNMGVVAIVNNNFIWRIRNDDAGQDGQIFERHFGRRGDTVIAGCDFRGDGKADLAIVRGRTLHYRSLHGNEPTGSYRIRGGRHQDFSCADVTGDGREELITLSRPAHPSLRRVGNLFNVHDSSGNWILRRGYFGGRRRPKLIMADLDNSGIQRFGFYRRMGANNRAIFYINDEVRSFVLPRFNVRNGQITSGIYRDFENGGGFPGIIVKSLHDNMFYQKNLITRQLRQINSSAVNTAHLSVTRPVSVYSTKKANTSKPSNPKPPAGGGGSGGGGGQCGVDTMLNLACTNQSNCAANLYKHNGEHGGPVILFDQKFGGPHTVQLLRASDCSVIGGTSWAGWHNPSPTNGLLRSHYRFNSSCSSLPSNVIVRMTRNGQSNIGMKVANGCTRYEYH